MKKILYIVLDGLGDRPCPQLGDKTPLEAAHTPHLDSLAGNGRSGWVYTVREGIAPESDIAVISMLGYDAIKYYTGRGPLESYAAGLEVNEGDLAYRVNFATLGEGKAIVDRRVGRDLTSDEASSLSDEVNAQVKLESWPATFQFKNTVGHRGVLVIRLLDGKLSSEVTNTDPAYEKEGPFGVAKAEFENVLQTCEPVPGHEGSEKAQKAAALTNEFIRTSNEVLQRSEVNKRRLAQGKLAGNVILSRDAGDRLPSFPSMRTEYKMRFGCFQEMPVEKGIALLTGMEIVELPQPTDDLKADYTLRADLVLENLKAYDGLYVHIKGPDQPGHDGDAHEKKAVIAAIDDFFMGRVMSSLDMKNTIITVTSDHSTPCALKAHSADPVPVLVAGGGVDPDGVRTFSEKDCRQGQLGKMMGRELLPTLVKLAKK